MRREFCRLISATNRTERIERILRAATGNAFTGAVARVERRGRLVWEAAFGETRDDEDAQAVCVDTRFDLASITKLFVSTLALRCVEDASVPMDEPLVSFLPEWRRSPHDAITLRMLLAHTAGMSSGADYRTLFDRSVEGFVLAGPLAASPGERVIYSDLGMIALGVLLERARAQALPYQIARTFGRQSLGFVPKERERRAIPATECDTWRGRVQGRVHDEKASLMNGVAGHAGLFGTAADVAALAEVFLGALAGRDGTVLGPQLAREAVSEQAYDPVLRRGLGWALKTSDENSCGRFWSRDTFGHTGFTGTCVWADPQTDLSGVLLTNTLYFGRSDSRALRAAFFEALVEAFDR